MYNYDWASEYLCGAFHYVRKMSFSAAILGFYVSNIS